MKRICFSAGLVALGAAAAHAQYAPGLAYTEMTKPWSFTGVVRGFYDDNYLTLPKNFPGFLPNGTVGEVHSRDSFGIEASPGIYYNHSVENTLLSASYVYDVDWYEDREGTTFQTHAFNAKIDHEFSERYKVTASDSLVSAQDPGTIDPTVVATPLRVPGSNLRNTGNLDFTAQLTRLFDVHVGYANSDYWYQQAAGDEFLFPGEGQYASYQALLDRMDQTAAVDLRWKVLPETTGVFGYQYEDVGYTSHEYIIYPSIVNGVASPGFRANSRNSDTQYVYVGADESFTPNLNGSIRAGGMYIDYYNDVYHTLSPYVDASLTYQYMPQSTAQFGLRQTHNATDVAGVGTTSPVLDEESTAVYLSVSHRVTSRFTASALAQAQYSSFNGGGSAYDNSGEDFYTLNINFAYHFTPWLAGETGYNYSKLNSDLLDRSYTRDVVYLGVRATY
ncbi:MAG: outer membrane beta-barrel protein [Verrucomicrobiota bacterium]|jgi:hypothetical protein